MKIKILTILIFFILCLNSALGYEISLQAPLSVYPNQTFQVSLTVYNFTELAGFQVDIKTNTEILEIKRGESISNWSIFSYREFENGIRVLAARYKEETISSGTLLILTLKASRDNVEIEYSGILVNSAGNKAKFDGSVDIPIVEKNTTEVITTPIKNTAMNSSLPLNLHIITIPIEKIIPIIAVVVIVALIWKLRSG